MKNFSVVAIIAISVLLFLVSLLLPAFYTPDESIPGWFALLMGWLDLLAIDQVGWGIISWFASFFLPVAWLGLILTKFRPMRIVSLMSASAGLALALCALVMKQILISEGGNTTRILSMGAGFYLWLASFAVCIIGATVSIVQEANAPKVVKV